MRFFGKRRAALAAAVATLALAIGVPAATAPAANAQVGLSPYITCPPWYGIVNPATGCEPYWAIWLNSFPRYPF
jgi:ABC-type sugar transport system substrate-binding protein